MRKLRVFVFLIMATLLLLSASPPPTKANYAVRIYTVDTGSCVGPGPTVAGQWRRECDGSWSGWGWMPGEYGCSHYVVTQGEPCGLTPSYYSGRPVGLEMLSEMQPELHPIVRQNQSSGKDSSQ